MKKAQSDEKSEKRGQHKTESFAEKSDENAPNMSENTETEVAKKNSKQNKNNKSKKKRHVYTLNISHTQKSIKIYSIIF